MSLSDALLVSPTHLLHLAVAHDAPALRALDALIAAPAPCVLPPELLLHVRAHLLPALVHDVHAAAGAALAEFEACGAARLCAECAEYNAQVFGPAPWEWPNFVHGCDCPRRTGDAPKPTAPITALGEKAPRCRREWLVAHLSTQLTPARPVWDAAEAMLANVDCTVVQPGPCAHETVEPTVAIVPRPGAVCGASALRRAHVYFALDSEHVSAPSDHQEDVRPFTTPPKTALDSADTPASDSASGKFFGVVGLGALGLAFAVCAARDTLVASTHAVLGREHAGTTLACVAGAALALRVGLALAA